jgi:hypothetical protein
MPTPLVSVRISLWQQLIVILKAAPFAGRRISDSFTVCFFAWTSNAG